MICQRHHAYLLSSFLQPDDFHTVGFSPTKPRPETSAQVLCRFEPKNPATQIQIYSALPSKIAKSMQNATR